MKKSASKKVYVAMSGGVDSSMAALLLKKQGYDVVGVFMKYWMDSGTDTENRCCSLDARHDAQRICAQIGAPFLTWDFQREFKKAVVDEFISQYKMGLTPNPCVTCNKEIKLGLFIEGALKEGADYVATGHYAKILHNKLYQAKDKKKDQSYFLYNLTQKQLKHILFPLGDLTKDKVRKIAQKAGLSVAFKKDSQEVCFVKDGDLKKFLSEKIKTKKGDIVLPDGQKVGEHIGAQFYTIGQRAPVGGTGPYYVIAKNIKKNQLIVAKGDDKELLVKEILVKNINWIAGKAPKMPFECAIKTRYQQKAQKAVIKKSKVIFKNPQRGVAPGQSAVFYLGKAIIGGGIIAY